MYIKRTVKLFVLFLIIVSYVETKTNFGDNYRKCERITIPMCTDVPYNATRMPNFIGHYTQAEAAIMAHEWVPLEYLGCSPLLKFFLCSMFAPLCSPSVSDIVPPCRSVCLTVKEACLPVLETFNLTWPHYLECNTLPSSPLAALCMEHPDHTYATDKYGPDLSTRKYSNLKPRVPQLIGPSSCLGPQTSVQTRHQEFCAPLCGVDFLYKSSDKNIAKIWMLIWAILCLLSSLFTVCTFFIDMTRVKYPERPIVWLAFCYMWYCIPFIARGIVSPALLSCDTTVAGESHLILGSIRSPGCIVTFMIQYYFMLASSLWWLILTISWFLSSGRYMVSEALQAYSSYFHASAWGFPAVGTIVVLLLKQVDGDELTGLCFVGSMRPNSYLWLVVVPLTSILCLGTVFIVAGFIGLCKIRRAIKEGFLDNNDGQLSEGYQKKIIDLGKFDKLMVRIGVFSGLYTLPAICVIAGHLYQYLFYDSWVEEREKDIVKCHRRVDNFMKSSTNLRTKSYTNPYPRLGYNEQTCELQKSIPYVDVMLLRIFMYLVVGITSGVWVWSKKTVIVWKKFFERNCCRQSSFNKYPNQPPPIASSSFNPTTNHWSQYPMQTAVNYPTPQQQPLIQMSNLKSTQISPKRHPPQFNYKKSESRFSDRNLSSSQTSQANTSHTAQL